MLLLLACTGSNTVIGFDTGVDDDGTTEVAGTVVDTAPDTTDDSGDGHGGDDTADAAEDAAYEAFFDRNTIQEVRLELDETALDALRREPREYTHGNVLINGERFDDVGVKLKGSSTFQYFDGKPAFKIELDTWVPDVRYAGLERITLNNMTGDQSQSREVIDYGIWADVGMSGPLASYAMVYVNDEYFGLYTNLESMDDHWAKRRYDDGDGDLWEGNDSCEFSRRGLRHWELAAGLGDEAALQAVVDALDVHSGDFYADMNGVLDMDQFIDFWAWSIAIGNEDGYPYHLNDVFLYGDPGDDGRFDFSPWGMDEAWYSDFYWSDVGGDVAERCLAESACTARLYDAVATALVTYRSLDVSGRAEAAWALSEQAMVDDPRRPWTPSEVEAAREQLATDLVEWPDRIERQMQ